MRKQGYKWFKTSFQTNRRIQKLVSKRDKMYIQWTTPLYENEVKGTFFVLRSFSDPPIDIQ